MPLASQERVLVHHPHVRLPIRIRCEHLEYLSRKPVLQDASAQLGQDAEYDCSSLFHLRLIPLWGTVRRGRGMGLSGSRGSLTGGHLGYARTRPFSFGLFPGKAVDLTHHEYGGLPVYLLRGLDQSLPFGLRDAVDMSFQAIHHTDVSVQEPFLWEARIDQTHEEVARIGRTLQTPTTTHNFQGFPITRRHEITAIPRRVVLGVRFSDGGSLAPGFHCDGERGHRVAHLPGAVPHHESCV